MNLCFALGALRFGVLMLMFCLWPLQCGTPTTHTHTQMECVCDRERERRREGAFVFMCVRGEREKMCVRERKRRSV